MGLPTDGSAWIGDCPDHVLRGGSWNNYSVHLRSASRVGNTADYQFEDIGFRVGRTLITLKL